MTKDYLQEIYENIISEGKIEIDNTRWKNENDGKNPSAKNRGSWIFTTDPKGDVNWDNKETFFQSKSMTYSEAVKAAKDYFKNLDFVKQSRETLTVYACT